MATSALDIGFPRYGFEAQVGQGCVSRNSVSGDQEAWLKDRLIGLTNTVQQISRTSHIEADSCMRCMAIEGAINGQAIEIIKMLGLEPAYVNLRRQ